MCSHYGLSLIKLHMGPAASLVFEAFGYMAMLDAAGSAAGKNMGVIGTWMLAAAMVLHYCLLYCISTTLPLHNCS